MSVQNTHNVSFCDNCDKKVKFAPECKIFTYVLTREEKDFKRFWASVSRRNIQKKNTKENGTLEDEYEFV